jgi:methylated-DNA-protein-cysteine methyltransferase-like protein
MLELLDCPMVCADILDRQRKFFCRQVWNTVAAIPPGHVASYGQIAKLAGFANGARLVGWALRSAPVDIDLPWHRVVNAEGKISIPTADPAHAEQVRRLSAESVRISGGRIDISRYVWSPNLDELVWGPPSFEVAEKTENVGD